MPADQVRMIIINPQRLSVMQCLTSHVHSSVKPQQDESPTAIASFVSGADAPHPNASKRLKKRPVKPTQVTQTVQAGRLAGGRAAAAGGPGGGLEAAAMLDFLVQQRLRLQQCMRHYKCVADPRDVALEMAS